MMTESAAAPTLRQRVHTFFYAEEVPYGPALVRILMPLVLLIPMAPRWLHTRELYSTDGAPTPLWIMYGWPYMLPEPSGTVAVILHSALIFFLLTSSAGWCTRLSLIASTVLYTYLNLLDAVSTITKYSCIATHVLLLLSLSQCGAVWSIDALLKRRRQQAPDWPGEPVRETSQVWPGRLMQLMIGIVYFGAAITKMHTPAFFSGDQMMFWMISQLNWEHALGEYLALVPAVIIVCAYITIVWEVMFVFLCWGRIGRPVMIGLGVLFHAMTWLTLGLFVFPLVCITAYFAFLNEQDVQRAARLIRRASRKIGMMGRATRTAAASLRHVPVPQCTPQVSMAALSAAVVLVCAAGVAVEHLRDPYGLRRAEGRHALRELDTEQAKAMLQPTGPIQAKDKIFAFDLGQTLVGGNLLHRRRDFRHGESMIAQLRMNPPYEDMWVECHLADADGHRITCVGQTVVSRELPLCNFFYTLDPALQPGEYSMVLLTAGKEVMRKTFSLAPGVGSPVAN